MVLAGARKLQLQVRWTKFCAINRNVKQGAYLFTWHIEDRTRTKSLSAFSYKACYLFPTDTTAQYNIAHLLALANLRKSQRETSNGPKVTIFSSFETHMSTDSILLPRELTSSEERSFRILILAWTMRDQVYTILVYHNFGTFPWQQYCKYRNKRENNHYTILKNLKAKKRNLLQVLVQLKIRQRVTNPSLACNGGQDYLFIQEREGESTCSRRVLFPTPGSPPTRINDPKPTIMDFRSLTERGNTMWNEDLD